MDETDQAIDGIASKPERVASVVSLGVVILLCLGFLLYFVAYGLGFKPNPWWWMLALIVVYIGYSAGKPLLDGKFHAHRKYSQPPEGMWSQS